MPSLMPLTYAAGEQETPTLPSSQNGSMGENLGGLVR